jgi:hypothetical protein
VTILAATRLEERAIRRELKAQNVRVVRSGVGRGGTFDDDVISCGLAGGVRENVASGTVVIASEIVRPNGERVACDPQLVAWLSEGARTVGVTPLIAPIITTATLVRGDARKIWSHRGFAAVDMESGLIFSPRLAALRVILDTPQRELSEEWLMPKRALFTPRVWRELPWLARNAPGLARKAARIMAAGLLSVP